MKLILMIILLTSCAHRQETKSLKEANKYTYLQEFYKTRDELKKESKSCKHYMKNQFSKMFLKTKQGSVIKNMNDAANTYSPEIFDWNTKTKIQELYLSYEYSYDIVNEHYEIFNNIKDCMNDFANMEFIRTTIKSFKRNKIAATTILKKYISYIQKSDLSPLNVLITANLISEMERFKIISISKSSDFHAKKNNMEKLFSESGKKSLVYFRDKDFENVYKLDLILKKEKDSFKKYLLNTITFI